MNSILDLLLGALLIVASVVGILAMCLLACILVYAAWYGYCEFVANRASD